MSLEPVRLLLVDDIEENLVALEALLRDEGVAIHRARSGPRALELLLAHDYALALLDVNMPDMDGYELAELMRGTGRTRRVPIIFVTAAASDERRQFRGYEAGAVDYIFKPIDARILQSKVRVFVEIARQAQELARQRDAMRALSGDLATALARLKAHKDNSPLALVELDEDLAVRDWSQSAERMFGYPARAMVGRPVEATGWLGPEGAAALRAALLEPAGEAGRHRGALSLVARHAEGRAVDCEGFGSVLQEGTGGRPSLAVQILDVTERRRSEEMRMLLIGELNHRVKNTLANVQAIAQQTMRRTPDPAAFARAFSGRLQALAGAHSILSATTWAGAELGELVADQIRVGTLAADRVRVAGPVVQLSPDAALRMALMLHELATNAAKYGALSGAAGLVTLRWDVADGVLTLGWEETGGPRVASAPAHRGFGSSLIGASAGQGHGHAAAEWREGGVVWTIRLAIAEGAVVAGSADADGPAPGAPPPDPRAPLAGRRVLVIEDEALVALSLVADLEEAGATVVGRAASVAEAVALVERVPADAALLDGNLGGEPVEAVAEALARRAVPFCFVSGYGPDHLPAAFRSRPVVPKPFTADALVRALGGLGASGGG